MSNVSIKCLNFSSFCSPCQSLFRVKEFPSLLLQAGWFIRLSHSHASCCTCPCLRCIPPWRYLFLCMCFGVLDGQLGFKHGFTHLQRQGEPPCCLRLPKHFGNATLCPFTEAAESGGWPRKRKSPIPQVPVPSHATCAKYADIRIPTSGRSRAGMGLEWQPHATASRPRCRGDDRRA